MYYVHNTRRWGYFCVEKITKGKEQLVFSTYNTGKILEDLAKTSNFSEVREFWLKLYNENIFLVV